jgi:hypothetical protein
MLPELIFNRKQYVIAAKAGHEVKRFRAIRKVKALSWIPAFGGMTLKDSFK